jgi:hypothetical protein
MSPSHARALWIEAPGRVAMRREPLPKASPSALLVRTLFTGISRGTEALVLSGAVPESEYERMRAPQQAGAFPFPVKYGYALVGQVEDGPEEWHGRIVFALCPHQDHAVISADMAHAVPDCVPPERAVLAANMETALNVVWDAAVQPGDRVCVIGGGVVGMLVAYIASGIPAAEVTLIDTNPDRGAVANRLGLAFAAPEAAPTECDVVVHVSASEAGLGTAIACAGQEARIIEASWYGTDAPRVPLGGAFHSRRLQIIASQVGEIPAHRRARWTYARRMQTALSLLVDPRLDALISGETAFDTIVEDYPRVLGCAETLCHRIRY